MNNFINHKKPLKQIRGGLLIALLALTACGPAEHDPTITRNDYGAVVAVSDCHAGKRRYRCRVQTTRGTYSDMDVSDFPGETVGVGDVLFYEVRNNGARIKTLMCKNNSCTPYGICDWWMPCFTKKR